ncbi:TVP38/TMEM64 family protein [Thiolapillus brandeum]|uniref:TVP38/TMEM64 family membrane protein n=1 Tax=Thiolapillus brandeum TaxID=1076588 RepID=A0A7U6GJ25_9GAMM|nr:TVP38/TMEM64 family protein [Thiolapillus brandeum]BAO44534.1 conserved hypothetical protein [Thiolapillus brandeum]
MKSNPKLLRILVVLMLTLGVALTAIYRDRLDVKQLGFWLDGAGWAGPILFMLLYALATLLFFPGSILTLAGGALFGPVAGTVYNLTGATLGAALAFLLARYLARDWVEAKAAGRLRQLKEGVEREGWHFVAFVRLVPLFPFNLLNYALGLTRIPFIQYTVASGLFMLPGALAYTWLGYAGREALSGNRAAVQQGLIALSLLASVIYLSRWLSRRRGKKET